MTKIEMQKELEKLRAENEKLKKFYQVGWKLSNVAYNYSQYGANANVEPDLKEMLRRLCREWDAINGII